MKLRTILTTLALIAMLSTLAGIGFHFISVRTIIIYDADNRAASQAIVIKDFLSSFLAGSTKAVEVLAANRVISNALSLPTPEGIDAANLTLDNFARVFGGGISFLADRDGVIVGSSNRKAITSYVGKSVKFRDYFQQAIEGKPGMFMPFGETTADRRVFYSSPVYEVGAMHPAGAVVIKGSINLLEKMITLPAGETWVLTDRNSIVFASSNKRLLYRVLWEKTPELVKNIEAQPHLGQGPWGWLGMKKADERTCIDLAGKIYRYRQVFVEESPGWDIVYLTDQQILMEKFYSRLMGINLFVPAAFLIIIWGAVLLMYRRANADILRRKLAEEKLQEHNEYMDALSETTYGLITRIERSELLERIISKAGNLSGTENGFIYLYDPLTDELELQYGSGFYSRQTGARVRPGEGISGKVFQSGQNLLIDDYASWEGRLASSDYDTLHSVIGFPLNFEGEDIGVIGLGHFEVGRRFGQEAIDILGRFAKLASIVLYNMRLYERLEKELAERREAEDALRDSEKRYRDFFNDDLSGAYISRPDGRLVDCNPAFIKMFGVTSSAEVKAVDIGRFYAEKGEREHFLAKLQKNGRVHSYKSKLKKVDGTPIHVIESAVGVFDENGELLEIKGYIQDVTQQKSLESQLRQALKMEAVGTLAGGIAHDFNNLLMAIEGNTALMRLDMDTGHPHCRKLENIEKHVRSGSRLTAQLLGYARKGRYESKTVYLNTLVEETAEAVGRTNKHVTVKLDLAKALHPVKADRGQIEQVLFNLFINAVDAMPAGGTLVLKTDNGSEKMMSNRVYQAEPGNYIRLTVSDNGTGMDRQTQDRIFDPFFTTKEMGRGTGLGLASVYGIIKGHTGYIDVASEPGKGTTFTVCLPAEGAIPPMTKQAADGPIKGQGTILLVDDEEVIVEVGREYLEVMGYSVYTARGGQKALEIFTAEHRHIDLVVLDMIMPDMGGGEVYDRFKLIDREVKVLLSSGYSLGGQASEILGRGCNGFIQKPFGMRALSLKIKEVLEGEG